MKRFKSVAVILLFCSLAIWSSCNNTGVSLDPTQVKTKVDSIVQVQSVAIRDSANAACQLHIQTHLAVKADSIVSAKASGK